MDRRPGTSPFANRSFRLLFAGGSVSVVGDQFTLVALPWLVLQLTGNPAQLGLVLAVMALPRAGLILVGGAVDAASFLISVGSLLMIRLEGDARRPLWRVCS